MKRKIWALLMAGIIAVGALTGCGNSNSKPSSDSAAGTESGGLDLSEEVELTMYVISDRPAGQDIVEENLNKILKEKLNCTLKINYIGWAEYANKYPLLFSSGEEFDMAYCATWLNFSSLAQRGAFKALDELWPAYAPDNYAKASDTAKQQATVNGSIYCVPTLLSTYNTYATIYRTDIMEGTDWNGKMETLEDVEAYCDIVKANHPELEPLDIYSSGSEWYYHIFMPMNGMYLLSKNVPFLYFDPMEDTPVLTTAYEYEKTPEFLEMMARWNEKGFFSKSALADTDSTKTLNGKAAVKIHNIDTYSDLCLAHPEWGFDCTPITPDVAHLPYTQDCMVISNTSKHPERALAFWNLLTTDQEVYDAYFYGVLDTTYTLNDKEQYKITDTDTYMTGAMWAARTTGLNRNADGVPEKYDEMKAEFESKIEEGKGNEKYAGFIFDTSSIETEFANCTNVQQQYWWPLELGYTDAETGLAEYQSRMQDAGIEKVREEMQRQLDEYIATLQ